MADTEHPNPSIGPDKYQTEYRKQIVETAKKLPLLDAVWKVVFYNRRGYQWGKPPYPDRISFDELEHSWTEDMLAQAISRASALYQDAYRIGDLHHTAKFEKKACQAATANFINLHPGYSERTYEEVISHGCFLAR